MTQKQFYKSRAWRLARQAYIDYRMALDGGICEVCHENMGKVVHHKIWLDDINCNDPEISLNPKHFRYECQDCHNKEEDPRHKRRRKNKKSFGRCDYGPNGEVLPKYTAPP